MNRARKDQKMENIKERSRKIKQNENIYFMSDDSHSRRWERGCGRGHI